MAKNYILDPATVDMKLQRMAYEIIENNLEEEELVLVGISDNGAVIARNVERLLGEIASVRVVLIELSLDKKHPAEIKLSSRFDFNGKTIIIVDDVANSGRTMLYSLKPFL